MDTQNENIEESQNENKQEINVRKRNKIVKSFVKTFQEFLLDIQNSYLEYKQLIQDNYILDPKDYEFNLIIVETFMQNVNPFLTKISNKDESIFTNKDEQFIILKDIDFSKIWENSNAINKSIIWKYDSLIWISTDV